MAVGLLVTFSCLVGLVGLVGLDVRDVNVFFKVLFFNHLWRRWIFHIFCDPEDVTNFRIEIGLLTSGIAGGGCSLWTRRRDEDFTEGRLINQ